jgi:hypothetical protein
MYAHLFIAIILNKLEKYYFLIRELFQNKTPKIYIINLSPTTLKGCKDVICFNMLLNFPSKFQLKNHKIFLSTDYLFEGKYMFGIINEDYKHLLFIFLEM